MRPNGTRFPNEHNYRSKKFTYSCKYYLEEISCFAKRSCMLTNFSASNSRGFKAPRIRVLSWGGGAGTPPTRDPRLLPAAAGELTSAHTAGAADPPTHTPAQPPAKPAPPSGAYRRELPAPRPGLSPPPRCAALAASFGGQGQVEGAPGNLPAAPHQEAHPP